MHEDLLPFTGKVSDINGVLSSAPVIVHTEHYGQDSILPDFTTDQVLYNFTDQVLYNLSQIDCFYCAT